MRVSHGWWDSFRRRHPNLTLHTAAPVSYARVMGSDPSVISKCYDVLERTLADNDLINKPSQINEKGNATESHFSLSGCHPGNEEP